MTDLAMELRREYRRKWYKRNPEKQREYNRRYWERKAQKARETDEKSG